MGGQLDEGDVRIMKECPWELEGAPKNAYPIETAAVLGYENSTEGIRYCFGEPNGFKYMFGFHNTECGSFIYVQRFGDNEGNYFADGTDAPICPTGNWSDVPHKNQTSGSVATKASFLMLPAAAASMFAF